MNTTQQSIEKKYQEILRDVEQDILFSVLQSPYQKIITKTHRENILYYIAASFIMEET